MKTIIKSNYEEIPRFVTVKLGQKIYKNTRSELTDEESFSGRYADVNIFRNVLSEDDIKSLSKCDVIANRGMLLDWFISSYETVGDVQFEDVARSTLCKRPTPVAIFNHGLKHDNAKFVCSKLGGELPTFGNSSSTRRSEYEDLKKLFVGSVSKTTCLVSENMNTDNKNNREATLTTTINVEDNTKDLYIWTGVTEEDDIFVNEYTKEPIEWDPNLWPGPVGNFTCTMARGNYLVIDNFLQIRKYIVLISTFFRSRKIAKIPNLAQFAKLIQLSVSA